MATTEATAHRRETILAALLEQQTAITEQQLELSKAQLAALQRIVRIGN